jgi:hypothetical protein
MVAPIGVEKLYDTVIPIKKDMTEITTEQTVTEKKVLNNIIAVNAGKMMRLDINRDPINRMPTTIVTDVNIANKLMYRLILIPIAFAKVSSNVTANNFR